MPQVPYTGAQSVEPNYPATPNVHPNASPEAFGAATAAASQRFGVSLEKAADSIFARAYSMQELDQQTAAMNAVSAATEKADARLIDYRSQQGLAAKNGYEPFVKDLNGIIAEGGAGLESDVAKKVYQDQMRYLHTHTLSSAASHAATQYKDYTIGSIQASANNSLTVIGMNPESDDVFNTEIKNLSGHARTMQAAEGWNDTKTTNWYNEQTSKAVATRAKLIGRTDPQRGQEILQDGAERNLIDGETAGQVSEFLRGKRNTISSRVESAKINDGTSGDFGRGKTATINARYAIGMIEGSGNYNPPHKYVTKGSYEGQKALGLYGVMQGNLQPWLAEARAAGIDLPKMSEGEFIKNHEAQDMLFDFKWGQIRKGVKSDNEAAVVWFAGEGGLKKYRDDPEEFAKVNDGGSTGPKYIQQFNKFLADKSTAEERKDIAHSRAKELAPGDPEFADVLHDKVQTDWNAEQSIKAKQDAVDKITVQNALIGDESGKLPTSMDQITDQKVHDIVDNSPKMQLLVKNILKANAKNLYTPTEENQAQVNAWWNKLNAEEMSPDDLRAAINEDFVSKPWPRDDVRKLIKLQNNLIEGTKKPPNMGHAIGIMKDIMSAKGLDIRKGDTAYDQILGELRQILQEEIGNTGKPVPDEKVEEISGRLLQTFSVKRLGGWYTGSEYEYNRPVDESKKAVILSAYQKKYPNAGPPTDAELQRFSVALSMTEFYDKKVKTDGQ